MTVFEKVKRESNKGFGTRSIESRIVDLSDWTKVEWNRILKASDYSQQEVLLPSEEPPGFA
ncbi:2150_t:CDS:2 [Gigaspora margarita]|uniref:2150_t:CDS:1 n=1 Tax=Gigaspora margarita TaxID=4874 RepID=A0ABN7V4P9_GIGMA|nr:2150_t:CDS:2 [Gigaspora margarita]